MALRIHPAPDIGDSEVGVKVDWRQMTFKVDRLEALRKQAPEWLTV